MEKPICHIVHAVRRNVFLRKSVILSWHIAGIVVTYYLAFLLRFDGSVPAVYLRAFQSTVIPLVVVNIAFFASFRLYSGIWAYFSIYDVLRILAALGCAFVVFMPAVFVAMGGTFAGFPRSIPVIEFLLLAFWMTGGRLAVRLVREYRDSRRGGRMSGRVLIVGNLADADHFVPTLLSHSAEIGWVVGIITDDTTSHHLTMRGIRVRGAVSDIGKIARHARADSILILPPYTRPQEMKRIVTGCENEGVACVFRMIPSLADLAAGRVELPAIRNVEIEDLLGRPEVTFDRAAVREMLAGKNILVTGAGGSIGCELVRQIAHYEPRLLILFDLSEFNLYTIDMELRREYPRLAVIPVAGNAGNNQLVRGILVQHEVQIVFHAAAYKHVPLMEYNVCACVANNTLATADLAAEAENAGVERFVLISTDKAVRPASVMGASKRLAERVVQERPKSRTTFVIVRFGNVLGSSGSVIPLFKKQIAEGGPVTVTSETATRFFMSIPEAVDLVLQAGVTGKDRDVMVLEMGEPIRVADMAKDLIELSGMRVGEDIEIVFTGLRPGEKEHEELVNGDESMTATACDKIRIAVPMGRVKGPALAIESLAALVKTQDEQGIRSELARLIPEASPEIGGTTSNHGLQ